MKSVARFEFLGRLLAGIQAALYVSVLCVFWGCEAQEESSQPVTKPLHIVVDDPAMDKLPAQAIQQNTSSGEEEKKLTDPQEMTVDLGKHRVFLPGQGWLSVQNFWELYYQTPEKLPDEMDFQLIEHLKELVPPE